MKYRTLGELAALLGAELHAEEGRLVTGFATDSRQVEPGNLFLAFRGEHVDGHEYVTAALNKGAAASLVERPVEGPHLLVPNVIDALAHMAGVIRADFHGPVVAITGSAGKTTTKEFVAAALSPLGRILKTRGNRNSEYTSPLLWTELEPATQAVVVEMAMRGFGQIRHLAAFTRPTVGLITNIGYAHLEQVHSREGIADAKGELLELLPPDGVALLWHEDDYLSRLRGKTSASVRTFGWSAEADSRISGYRVLDWDACEVAGVVDGQRWETRLNHVGRHIALNTSAAVLAAVNCGVEPQSAADGLAGAELPPMRMEIVERKGVRILLDTYNASPPSTIAAIETLAEMPVTGRRRAVLGEMRELGKHREAAHRSVGRALAHGRIDEAILVGEPTTFIRDEALREGMAAAKIRMASSLADVSAFLDEGNPEDAVLIKGSRALELERAL